MKLWNVARRDAKLSDDKAYRWWLLREIELAPRHPQIDFGRTLSGRVVWIMLNPSTADALVDDATIRRCMGFAYLWGFSEVAVVNLFAFRSTDPGALYRVSDPVGAENDFWIEKWTDGAAEIVAAWGTHGGHMDRARVILQRLTGRGRKVSHLGLTKDGAPKHPVRLANATKRLVLSG